METTEVKKLIGRCLQIFFGVTLLGLFLGMFLGQAKDSLHPYVINWPGKGGNFNLYYDASNYAIAGFFREMWAIVSVAFAVLVLSVFLWFVYKLIKKMILK